MAIIKSISLSAMCISYGQRPCLALAIKTVSLMLHLAIFQLYDGRLYVTEACSHKPVIGTPLTTSKRCRGNSECI